MENPKIHCPHCGSFAHFSLGNEGSSAMPPTGGDYEWYEQDKTVTCEDCGNQYEIRGRFVLGSDEFIRLDKSPKPNNDNIVWYAGVTADDYNQPKGQFSIYLVSFFKSGQEALDWYKAKINREGEKYKDFYQPVQIVKDAYKRLNGEILKEDDWYKDVIKYR